MIDITIQYWGQLRLAVGVGTEVVRIERGRCIEDLLAALAVRHGEAFRRLVFANGPTAHPSTFIAVDDHAAYAGDPTPLAHGTLLTIASPMGGG